MPLASLLFDTGLLVLIWLVQWVIYPSFVHMGHTELQSWHGTYTARISLVVVPLMVGQLIASGWLAFSAPHFVHILKLLLVLWAWVLTFAIFVPLHAKVVHSSDTRSISQKLVRQNWFRTLVWTVAFGLGLWSYLITP
jgi:hypothetical protein